MKKILKEFYAVTLTSVYYIQLKGHGVCRGLIEDKKTGELNIGYLDPEIVPVATKIAIRMKSSMPVGSEISGEMLSIGSSLIMFTPKGGGLSPFERRIEMVNTRYWTGQTSRVVGLFLEREQAENCFKSPDLNSCDFRWIKETKKVLNDIGNDHSRFSICYYPEMALISKHNLSEKDWKIINE